MSVALNEVFTLISVFVVGAFLALFGKKKLSKKKADDPPENVAAKAAIDDVQQSFEEEIDRIRDATNGPSPADDLADLGNARRRR